MAWEIEVLLSGAILATAVSAQVGGSPTSPGARTLALPRPGIPLSFAQVEERTQVLADESSAIQTVIRSMTYRDSEGRIRLDSETRDGAGRLIVSRGAIVDPTNGSCVILLDTEKTALRMPFPISADSKLSFGDTIDDANPSHHWKVTTESKGKHFIEGVEFLRTRIMQTAEDNPNIVRTFDYWNSGALKLTGAISISGTQERYTAQIQGLRQGEPDPAHFQIPSGFRVMDIPPPSSFDLPTH